MNYFKSLGYEKDEHLFEQRYPGFGNDTAIEEDDPITNFPLYVKYLDTLYSYRKSWAFCYRSKLLIRGQNTNNISEAQFGVIKDKLLQRVKEYNVVALVQKLLDDFSNHYKDKLESIASSSYDIHAPKRYQGKSKKKGTYSVFDWGYFFLSFRKVPFSLENVYNFWLNTD